MKRVSLQDPPQSRSRPTGRATTQMAGSRGQPGVRCAPCAATAARSTRQSGPGRAPPGRAARTPAGTAPSRPGTPCIRASEEVRAWRPPWARVATEGLVQHVRERAGKQVGAAPSGRSRPGRPARLVVTAVASGTSAGRTPRAPSWTPARTRPPGPPGGATDAARGEGPAGSARRRRGAPAPVRRAGRPRRCRGGPRSPTARPSRSSSPRRSPSIASARRTPAVTAVADEPRPRPSGTRFTERRAKAGARTPASAATRPTVRTRRLVAVWASSSFPSPSTSTPGSASVSTTNWFQRSSASARQSNPGPRLATVAGARARSFTRRPVRARAPRPRPRAGW